jgi:dienelactone hydrolase
MRQLIACVFALCFALPAMGAEFSYKTGPKEMRVDVYAPEGKTPRALVLVLHTSGGLQSADTDYAKKLVAQGYAAAVPHFLDAYGITPQQRRHTWTNYRDTFTGEFSRIADEVSARLKTDRARVLAVGFSNGGYWAAYLAGKGVIKAGVCYYGALTEAGNDRELEHLGGALKGRPVPVLIMHGTADDTVPVGAARRLQKQIQGNPSAVVIYEGAEHRFERESGAANEKATADAWKRTLDFLAAQ